MKHLFMLTIVSLLTACACTKNSKNPQLPPITQEGKNTFGCLVDGKVFTNQSGVMGPKSLNAYYKKVNNSYEFLIGAISNREDKPIGGIKINLSQETFFEINKNYLLTSEPTFAITDIRFDEYSSVNQQGTIIFLKFDTINNIASGKFNFKAVNKNDASMLITDGRFDVKFSNQNK